MRDVSELRVACKAATSAVEEQDGANLARLEVLKSAIFEVGYNK